MATTAPPVAQATLVTSVPDYNELVREIQRYQTENVRLRAQLAQYDAGAKFATEAMRGALRSSSLEHALRGVVATDRGKRQLAAAMRPARVEVGFNTHAATVRRILGL